MAYGFKAESYSKRLVSETAVFQVAMSADRTISDIASQNMSAGSVQIDLQGEDLIEKDTGAVKVKKAGYYRLSAEVDITSLDSGVTHIDAGIWNATQSKSMFRHTVSGAAGTFIGVMTIGPKIVQLNANDRLLLNLKRSGSGSVTAKGTTSTMTVEWVGPAA